MTEAGLSGLGVEDESENVGPIVKKALFGDFGGDKADYTLGKLAGARHYTIYDTILCVPTAFCCTIVLRED